MGGLGPGIGGFEVLVIGLVALLVVGPKDLPVMLRKLGQLLAKARGMANDFRSSFDEMARQTELDELRKEVEALRQTQMLPLGAEAEATFREINTDLNRPVTAPATEPQPLLTGPEEFADPGPSTMGPPRPPWPETPAAEPAPAKTPRPRAAKAPATAKPRAAAKAVSTIKAKTTTATATSAEPKTVAAKPRAPRKTAVRP